MKCSGWRSTSTRWSTGTTSWWWPKETDMADLQHYIETLAAAARKASVGLRTLTASTKNAALAAMAQSLDGRRELLAAANARDLERGRKAGLSGAMLDRLTI